MGRKSRIEYYGAIYYIIQRGNNRKPIFIEDRDKKNLLEILSETKEIYDFKIYAYVIMDNYYHFLIQTFNIPISKVMHSINTRYAKYYNSSRKRTGPVFKGRYIGILVQDESYILTLTRYIHNNPICEKICTTMENYKWSSDIFYRINMESIVDIDELLNMLSLNRTEAINKYIELMAGNSIDNSVFKDISEKSHIIGTDEFKNTITNLEEKQPLDLDQILEIACPRKEDYRLIKEGSRKRYLTKYKKIYVELGRKAGYTYEQIGNNIGVTRASARLLLKSK